MKTSLASDSDSCLAEESDGLLWRLDALSVGQRLCDVTLEITEGVTAVLGPSGAGKSTLLDALTGQVRPSAGTCLNLYSSATVGETRQGVPIMWAGCGQGLWPHLSVAGQISAVGGDPDEWLPRFDLDRRKQVRPASLSQGERSRCELARALAARPRVLVLDEPLTHVDLQRSAAGWRELATWCEQKDNHLIFATHDLSAARSLADRCVVLDAGEVIDKGSAEEVFARLGDGLGGGFSHWQTITGGVS